MPLYERAVLWKNTGVEQLNFHHDELLIMEGTTYVDFPLHEIMNEHYLTRASLTSIAKEVNLSVKSPIPEPSDDHEILGYCELPVTRGVPGK
jgi:hypothetical protein